LRFYILVISADWTGSGDVDRIAGANCSGEADDGLVRGAAAEVLPGHNGLLIWMENAEEVKRAAFLFAGVLLFTV
jgi:hypothetical protein